MSLMTFLYSLDVDDVTFRYPLYSVVDLTKMGGGISAFTVLHRHWLKSFSIRTLQHFLLVTDFATKENYCHAVMQNS